MKSWLFCALGAMGLWGLWGFLGKAASRGLPPRVLLWSASLGCLSAFLLGYLLLGRGTSVSLKEPHALTGFLSGLFLIGGLFLFYLALEDGETTRVVFVTAAYPAVPVLLVVFFLGETLTAAKIAGSLLVLAGVFLLGLGS